MNDKKSGWIEKVFQILVGGGLLAVVVTFFLPRFFPEPMKFKENISLKADMVIGDGNNDCLLPTLIKTNGFNLEIRCDEIQSSDTTILTGFDELQSAQARGKSGDGTKGTDGKGENGGSGKPGADGIDGNNGRSAGSLLIVANQLFGSLSVSNNGQNGGNGGRGGEGGNGGKGGKGHPSRGTDCVNLLVGKVCNCKGGPGRGGKGGDGGPAGRGGDAGDGGDAGEVTIKIGEVSGTLFISSFGGKAGKPGLPGTPGNKGQGGAEGDLIGCDSAHRTGSSGENGSQSIKGEQGSIGKDGLIQVEVDGFAKEVTGGSFKFPTDTIDAN